MRYNQVPTLKQKSFPAFTLIELLVVIAIIGVLVAVAVPIMSRSREKARIASGQKFATTVHSRLAGSGLVADWRFNECNGNTARDLAGNSNATILGTASWSTEVPVGTGCSIHVGGTFSIAPDNDAMDIGTGSMTWSQWFKLNSATNQRIYRKLNSGIYIDANAFYLRCNLTDSASGISINAQFSKNFNDNKWHHSLCTLDRVGNELRLYVDGLPVASASAASLSGVDLSSNEQIQLGGPGGDYYIDDFRIYNSAYPEE
jgi:prepilin-type N-terminal cleavage/methylation domain-containing protein